MWAFARENGWIQALIRGFGSSIRKLLNASTALKLKAPHFRVGRFPRLLGLSRMHIGENFSAGDGLWLEAVVSYQGQRFSPELMIGHDVTVSDYVHIACLRRIEIGSGTLIGSRVIVTDHSHGVYRGEGQDGPELMPALRPLHSAAAVKIGQNVWIGDGVAVLAGAVIGDGAIVGANSVVTGAIPAKTIAVGAPARPVRQWSDEGQQWVSITQASADK